MRKAKKRILATFLVLMMTIGLISANGIIARAEDSETPTEIAGGGETPEGSAEDGEKPEGSEEDGETPDGLAEGGETPDGSADGGETPDGSADGGETPEDQQEGETTGNSEEAQTPAVQPETQSQQEDPGKPLKIFLKAQGANKWTQLGGKYLVLEKGNFDFSYDGKERVIPGTDEEILNILKTVYGEEVYEVLTEKKEGTEDRLYTCVKLSVQKEAVHVDVKYKDVTMYNTVLYNAYLVKKLPKTGGALDWTPSLGIYAFDNESLKQAIDEKLFVTPYFEEKYPDRGTNFVEQVANAPNLSAEQLTQWINKAGYGYSQQSVEEYGIDIDWFKISLMSDGDNWHVDGRVVDKYNQIIGKNKTIVQLYKVQDNVREHLVSKVVDLNSKLDAELVDQIASGLDQFSVEGYEDPSWTVDGQNFTLGEELTLDKDEVEIVVTLNKKDEEENEPEEEPQQNTEGEGTPATPVTPYNPVMDVPEENPTVTGSEGTESEGTGSAEIGTEGTGSAEIGTGGTGSVIIETSGENGHDAVESGDAAQNEVITNGDKEEPQGNENVGGDEKTPEANENKDENVETPQTNATVVDETATDDVTNIEDGLVPGNETPDVGNKEDKKEESTGVTPGAQTGDSGCGRTGQEADPGESGENPVVNEPENKETVETPEDTKDDTSEVIVADNSEGGNSGNTTDTGVNEKPEKERAHHFMGLSFKAFKIVLEVLFGLGIIGVTGITFFFRRK